MMSTRTYLSGSAKRELKKQKEISRKKFASACSLEKFKFTVNRKPDEHVPPSDDLFSSERSATDSPEPIDSSSCLKKKIEVEDDNLQINNDKPLEPSTVSDDVSLFSLDPALWSETVSKEMVELILLNPPPQNTHLLPKTERIFAGVKRTLTMAHFYHTKINGEKLQRKWLVLSESSLMLFCWVCKLMNTGCSSSFKGQLINGFCDWKHASDRLKEHENSSSHKQAMMNVSLRSQISQRVDATLILKYDEEKKYWISVLQRTVSVVKFLALRGLPFFGDNETIGSIHNGNFLGCLELIAEFDPFLSKHLERYGNPGKGNVNYMSSTCVNQFIEVMAQKVQKTIVEEVILAKYFSIIIDSTPDITHLDQLCFVLRYVVDDEPVERFLKFIPIYSHKSECLEEIVITTLREAGIDIMNCRGQSYDNASNMSGKYSGLQARIKSINSAADFVPCAAHSLNLVGVNAVESCSGAIQFFSVVQNMYTFFSLSTHRWQVLKEELEKNGDSFTIKNRCATRWCSDAKAVKALRKNYATILLTLSKLSSSENENACTKLEAQVLHKKLQKFETILNITVWDALLQRLNATSVELQKSTMTLSQVGPLYQSLIDFTQYVRDNFEFYEKSAKDVCAGNLDYEVSRKKIKPRSKDPHAINSSAADLTPRDLYKSSVHYAICDSLIAHLYHRKEPYDNIAKKFSCMSELKEKSTVREKAIYLQEMYPLDLDNYFPDELLQFSSLVQNESILEMFKKMNSLQLNETFANVDSAMRIFLTLPVSNCSGERSFSLLKRLKSPRRSNILQGKLSALALLCIEGEITQKLDYNEVISNFANLKLRKKSELLHS